MKAVVLIFLVHAATAASPSVVTTAHGTLTLDGIVKRGADAHVRGSFRSLDGNGIRFLSTPDYLRITTTDGESIVEVSNSPVRIQTYGSDGFTAYFQLLDKAYIEIDDHTYSLPAPAFVQSVSDPIQRPHILAHLQAELLHSDLVQTAVKESVERLVAHPAIRLLEPAAQALGQDLGVTGVDHPAALRFYLTAMKLTEARAKTQEAEKTSYNDPWRRYFEGAATLQTTCLRTCPPCPDDDCLGMCGYGCNCWQYICGDCCYHLGCYEHDLCCREKFSQSRCLFPIGFQCESTYRC